MERIEDSVFGVMDYKHAWKKEEMLSLWGERYPIQIIAQAYSGEKILDIQREQYKKYQEILQQSENQLKEKIQEYVCEFYQEKIDVKTETKPTGIVFCRNGQWGVLFEMKYDVENGMAAIFDANEIRIGTQDDFF